jgi:FkbH-like protein
VGIKNLSKSIFSELSLKKDKKKVLLLDCDNTLWGGVIGEDGYNKVLLGDEGVGLIFKNFQKIIKKLVNNGVLIALVSKNNESDVLEIFRKNKNMILKEKDITAMKVNWQEKSKNIIELSKELSLGTESFVFWDDNPIERKKVKMKVRNVTVIDPNKNIEEWPKQLANLDIFKTGNFTKEDKIKTQLYKIRDNFENNKKNYSDEIQYLKSINISIKTHDINKNNINRAEQLCNKTNQFNLNLKRLNQKEILKLAQKKNYDLKMLSLKDDYGEHGLIAIYGIYFSKDKFTIDLFAMSCRVLGRYLENWILNKIKNYAKEKKKRFCLR